MTLHVVTPSMRHGRLGALAANLGQVSAAGPLPIDWHVCLMPHWSEEIGARVQRLDATLRSLKSGAWIIVSDDNLLHPSLPAAVAAHAPGWSVIMFGQRLPNGSVRSGQREQLLHTPHECDGGAFVVDAAFYASAGFGYTQFGYERHLFRNLHALAPSRFRFDPRPLTYHDAQRHS